LYQESPVATAKVSLLDLRPFLHPERTFLEDAGKGFSIRAILESESDLAVEPLTMRNVARERKLSDFDPNSLYLGQFQGVLKTHISAGWFARRGIARHKIFNSGMKSEVRAPGLVGMVFVVS